MRRYAVVLGASGGIGQAICRELAKDGWSLYMHYNRHEQKILQLQQELAQQYEAAEFNIVHADFSTGDAANHVTANVGHVQAVIVALGQSLYQLVSDTTTEQMDELWHVHVRNPAAFIRDISPQLRSFPVSYVVIIGSIWGDTGAAGEVMYSAVKGAQHAFVKAYAKEAAYSGIRVNAIAPGWIDTEMTEQLTVEDKQLVMEEIPLQSTGNPSQVAALTSFLVSGKADYMTGEVVRLNGGWYI